MPLLFLASLGIWAANPPVASGFSESRRQQDYASQHRIRSTANFAAVSRIKYQQQQSVTTDVFHFSGAPRAIETLRRFLARIIGHESNLRKVGVIQVQADRLNGAKSEKVTISPQT